jgi:hypothetical protein
MRRARLCAAVSARKRTVAIRFPLSSGRNGTRTQFGVIDPTLPTIIPTRDIRDYREDELTLRGTYELKPQMGVFVERGISQEVYQQPVSVSGITRDSSGYELLSA